MIDIGLNSPTETYTLSQFINFKDSDSVTYRTLSVLNRSITNSKLVYSIDNLVYNYMDEINAKKKILSLKVEERLHYAYKPKLLSYDIYGTTETYFIILAMNGMCNLKEFDLENSRLNVLMPSDMSDLISKILNAENQFIKLNRSSQEIL